MIKVLNPKDCCGCTACASICSRDAIDMKPDSLGFLYPVVDESKCVDCGLCDKVCSFNDQYDKSLNLSEPITYGARHKDIAEVMQSRSGAIFVALSDYIIEHGGIVYGAGFDDHFRVVHKRASTKIERDEFRGSKYVQSQLIGIFRQVKQDLKEGLTVLFSGTPCQTAGLRSFLGGKYNDRLILVDIVCHGVPSPYIWRDYIQHLEKKEGSPIVWVNFRDKEEVGWNKHFETFRFNNIQEKKYRPKGNWFTKFFYKHIMFRYSCYDCHFCNLNRPSDLTLADFWGWEKQNISINQDDKGLNLVIINTLKGADFFDLVKDNIIVFPAIKEAYLQPNLQSASSQHKKRGIFESDYKNHGFEYVYNHSYNERPLIIRGLLFVKYQIKRYLR